MKLEAEIEKITGIGPKLQKRLKKLGIKTVKDLLLHFPHRYEDFSNLIKVCQIKEGENFSAKGWILEIKNWQTWKKRMNLTEAIFGDETGTVKIVWFNQPFLKKILKKGDFVCLAGKLVRDEYGIYVSNPYFEKISPFKDLIHTARLIPIYPETEGVTSKWLRSKIREILLKLKGKIEDPLPKEIRKEYKLLPVEEAFWQVHFPDSLKSAKRAKERFAFEELFLIQLFVLKERIKLAKEKAIKIPIDLNLIKEFVEKLPFKLTDAQRKASWQILKDMEKERPMNRLLEGDVGSGKTIVAMIAALNVAKFGFQVAFMAPTEILARQHFENFLNFLKGFNLKIGLLTSEDVRLNGEKLKKKEILKMIEDGEVEILIGTHSLIQKDVKFKNLAFVIVDEQHRFGVEQRAKLLQNANFKLENVKIPHLLSMTATPIPRTLALTIYGDLDLSILDQMPKGKRKVKTMLISPKEKERAYEFIKKEIKKGGKVFVICPRIEPDKELGLTEQKAVKKEYQKLKEIFPEFKIGMLHGKMKSKEKEEVMEKFKKGEIEILVSTSVVEVGVDIPKATLMIVEGAERFGLAQLHQFRGRIGRSGEKAYFLLFTESSAKKTRERLKALLESESGFELAEKDLKIRGPGQFFGSKQWGIPDLAMSSLTNVFLVEKTKEAAKKILEKDFELKNYPLLREKLENFKREIHLE
jgi:ATP-dependent DNA helicase RecG